MLNITDLEDQRSGSSKSFPLEIPKFVNKFLSLVSKSKLPNFLNTSPFSLLATLAISFTNHHLQQKELYFGTSSKGKFIFVRLVQIFLDWGFDFVRRSKKKLKISCESLYLWDKIGIFKDILYSRGVLVLDLSLRIFVAGLMKTVIKLCLVKTIVQWGLWKCLWVLSFLYVVPKIFLTELQKIHHHQTFSFYKNFKNFWKISKNLKKSWEYFLNPNLKFYKP